MKYRAQHREFQSNFYHGIQSLKFYRIDGFLESNKSSWLSNMSAQNRVKTDYDNLIVLRFDLSIDFCSAQLWGPGSHWNLYKCSPLWNWGAISIGLIIFSPSAWWCAVQKALFGCKIRKTSMKCCLYMIWIQFQKNQVQSW